MLLWMPRQQEGGNLLWQSSEAAVFKKTKTRKPKTNKKQKNNHHHQNPTPTTTTLNLLPPPATSLLQSTAAARGDHLRKCRRSLSVCTQLFWHLYLAKYLCDKGCELWVSDDNWANAWRKQNLTTQSESTHLPLCCKLHTIQYFGKHVFCRNVAAPNY